MYTSINIDFDVFKEITLRRHSPEVTENDVLREILKLESQEKAPVKPAADGVSTKQAWSVGGAVFPHGTEFRAKYKRTYYQAIVDDGSLLLNGNRYDSPSPAAIEITGTSRNGWTFWECRLPGSKHWAPMTLFRR